MTLGVLPAVAVMVVRLLLSSHWYSTFKTCDPGWVMLVTRSRWFRQIADNELILTKAFPTKELNLVI